MARTAIAVQQISRAGLTPAYAPANVDGYEVPTDNESFVHVKAGATGTTVTVPIPKVVDGAAVTSKQYVIAANGERMIGPFPADPYDQGGGVAHVNFSSVTTVTAAAFRT